MNSPEGSVQASSPASPAPAERPTVGVHLHPTVDPDGVRHSAVAVVDASGRLSRLDLALDDQGMLLLLPAASAQTAVDAPLRIPNDEGQRDIERLLAWCDAPAFPTSRSRLLRMHGRLRGPDLASVLAATGPLAEAFPDLLLRQLLWERIRGSAEPLDLAEYRRRFLAVRPPRYRPRGRGRAAAAGAADTADLLAEVLDLDGWRPQRHADDLQAIRDAASLDALAAAATAHRARREHPLRTLTLAGDTEGPYLLPADAEFRHRALGNLERLRSERAVSLREISPGGA